jgi:hypothetical protein
MNASVDMRDVFNRGGGVMRRCRGIYSVFFVLLKLIHMQWPQYVSGLISR